MWCPLTQPGGPAVCRQWRRLVPARLVAVVLLMTAVAVLQLGAVLLMVDRRPSPSRPLAVRPPPVRRPASTAERRRRAAPLLHLHLAQVMRDLHGSTDMELVRAGRLPRPASCPERAVIPWAGGRAGNMLFEYLTAWAVALRHDVPFLVPDVMIETFEGVFAGMTAQRGDLDLLLMDCAHLWHGRRNISVATIQDVWEDLAPITGWLELVGFPTNMTRPIYRLWHAHEAEMRAELRFSAPISSIVHEYLRRVRRALGPDDEPVMFIGVHVRRTDYYQATYNLDGVWMNMPGAAYFERAVRHYQRRYPNTVFVVVSDDMQWCREQLAPIDAVILFPGDAGNPPMLDLALLGHCNHTIITFGTFALSAAIMTGGDVVVPKDLGITWNSYERQKDFWPAQWTEISVL
ncbi:galactoside alpha-(1,2)-fucosyltransferase 2-like [Amphibalanus amphitrite]|uniref:galactoside alpha-(1,2)-fucosyltransferase 2-like n=1 Tax=Amphibalanus amphitrite TaxID=1232801 RepID=UPI001C918998|nr:galactoside alpha-(1,2)-fucosyltransferase 2-like [Amphibalanus amphitrite]